MSGSPIRSGRAESCARTNSRILGEENPQPTASSASLLQKQQDWSARNNIFIAIGQQAHPLAGTEALAVIGLNNDVLTP